MPSGPSSRPSPPSSTSSSTGRPPISVRTAVSSSSAVDSPILNSQSPILPSDPASRTTTNTSTTATTAFASTSSSAAAPSTLPGGSGGGREDIEMEPIAGHRRRKSSILSPSVPLGIGAAATAAGPAVASPIGTPSRPRAQSLRSPHHLSPVVGGSSFDPTSNKISEEGSTSGGSWKEEREMTDSSDEDLHDDEETGLNKKEKRRKQKKRRRNTLLDQRIAREKNITEDEVREADKSVVRRIAINVGLVILWYLLSLSISLYNKWMFDRDQLNFAFPLFTTSMHMLVQFILAALVLYFVPSLRPQNSHSSDQGRSRHETEPGKGMTKMFYLTRIGPCGLATGLDIGLGNTSLKFISLTFYTMCKSSSLAFVLLFAFLFRLEQPTWRLVTIIGTMTVGVVLMVFGEVEFKLGGFVLVMSAAFFSGFRWSLTQILLLRNSATSNPFSSIYFLSPVMFLTLFFLAIPVEGFGPLFQGLATLSSEWGAGLTPLFLLFPGCIAFLMTAAEFALLQRTSVVTLSIAGIFKEVVTISAASVVFKDTLTLVNLIGLVVTMVAIVAYNYIKITKMRQQAQSDVHGQYTRADSSHSSRSGSDVENDDGQEETSGLLRPSAEMTEPLVTSDGDLLPSASQADHSRDSLLDQPKMNS